MHRSLLFNRNSAFFAELVSGLILIFATVALLAISYIQQNEQAITARNAVLRRLETINELHILSSKLKSAVLGHHRYILLGDRAQLDEYNSFKSDAINEQTQNKHMILPDSVEANLKTLYALTESDAVQNEWIGEIDDEFHHVWDTLDSIIAQHDAGHQQQALATLQAYLKEHVTPLRVLIRDSLKREKQLLGDDTLASDEEADSRTNYVMAGLAIMTFLEGAFFILSVWQKRKAQLAEVRATTRANEADGYNRRLKKAVAELNTLNKAIQENSEMQISAVIDNALDGQIMMDASGKIIRFNRSAEKLFGYDADELIGESVTKLLIEPYASECLEHFRQHRELGLCNQPEHRHETYGCRKDKSIFPIDLSMSMFDLGGALHFSWFLRDITERKRAEADILHYTKELEKSNQDLDDFAYIASHDLKEPLRGLHNHAQFLLEDYQDKLDDDGKRRLHRLSFLAQRMEHLVSDLLYFSRLGRSEMAIQPADPNQMIMEIEHMIENLVQEKHATISVPATLPVLVCDKPRIMEAFRNLITNAITHNDKPDKEVEIGFLQSANAPHGPENNVFYVRDNGIGIEQQYYQEIFRIFRRLHKDGDNDMGTGSGLTFVRKIVERHRGHIWLESEVGKGTTFYFNIQEPERKAA